MRWRWMIVGVLVVTGAGLMVWDGIAGGRVETGRGSGEFLNSELNRNVDRISIKNLVASLSDQLFRMREFSRRAILLDRYALNGAGISPQALVRLNADDVPVSDAVELMVRQVDPQCRLSVYNGKLFVLVTSRETSARLRRQREKRALVVGQMRGALDQPVEGFVPQIGASGLGDALEALGRIGGVRIEVDSETELSPSESFDVFGESEIFSGRFEDVLERLLMSIDGHCGEITFEVMSDRIVIRHLYAKEALD